MGARLNTTIAFCLLGLVIFGFAFAGVADWLSRSSRPTPPTPAQVEPRPTAETGEGLSGPFRFQYTAQKNVVVATFTPFLPRNDAAFLSATADVIERATGDRVVGRPNLVGNELRFETDTTVYFVMPVKEQSGEVHSIRIRSLTRRAAKDRLP